jgi:ankyrin repeat protein
VRYTPLMLAAKNGFLDGVSLLLAAGAEPNYVDSEVLHPACGWGLPHHPVVGCFLF